MFKPERIASLIDEQRISKKEFCESVDIAVQTLDNVLKRGSELGCIKLERIADYFNVPMDYFFEREKLSSHNIGHNITGNYNKVNGNISINEYEKEIVYLKELLAEKERTIQILMKEK